MPLRQAGSIDDSAGYPAHEREAAGPRQPMTSPQTDREAEASPHEQAPAREGLGIVRRLLSRVFCRIHGESLATKTKPA